MATNKRSVQFANFICHFGNLEMLDLCEEVVIPAFTDGKLKRTYKDTSYFFHDVELISIPTDGKHTEPAIVGKFVKDILGQVDVVVAIKSCLSEYHVLDIANHGRRNVVGMDVVD